MILLDTHAAVVVCNGQPPASENGRERIVDASPKPKQLAVSAISFWEIALLVAERRVRSIRFGSGKRAISSLRGIDRIAAHRRNRGSCRRTRKPAWRSGRPFHCRHRHSSTMRRSSPLMKSCSAGATRYAARTPSFDLKRLRSGRSPSLSLKAPRRSTGRSGACDPYWQRAAWFRAAARRCRDRRGRRFAGPRW